MFVFSPTETRTITPTPSVTATQTPTTTLSPYPTIPYPLKPGPVITRENARRIVLLGTVPEKLAGGVAGAQLAWSPDSSRIAVTTEGEGVRIIDPLQMKEIGEILQNTEGIFDQPGGIAYSPDGKWLAVAIPMGVFSNPGDVYLYDSQTYRRGRDIIKWFGAYTLAFSHNGRWLAFGTHTVGGVIDLASGNVLFNFGNRLTDITFILFSWNDEYFTAYGNNMFTPILMNTKTWSLEYEIEGEICFSRDNKYFAMAPGIWSLGDFQVIHSFGNNFHIGMCDFGEQGDVLFTSIGGVGLVILETEKGDDLNLLIPESNQESINTIALSPDGRMLAVIDWKQGGVSFWGVTS